jgi:hypothetical protein
MVYYGIDNGITGAIGVIDEDRMGYLYAMPTKSTLNYQKTKVKHITRIDVKAFRDILRQYLFEYDEKGTPIKQKPAKALIERPMVNPQRFEATTSALRALEATLIVLESLKIGFDYVDSKAWQKEYLPYISVADKKDYPAKLKEVSKEVGIRKYPNIDWDDFKDADGILIAEYCKYINNYDGMKK